ncbi:glycosyltransferase family 2 protein [Oceanobacillus jeddahense]|uniref:Glycosyltransferase family 2 protein n=1 Tax=Oceanobacillus jeddahense TaxID=1462527 RepID=A0ABY5JR15_9BACI|nr:glycosyltransferase family A protein [Oceanobacillus jeddahense]UUI02566.1 glycosyltransferase family 2 protein [Oceanobacillus jeddahense]
MAGVIKKIVAEPVDWFIYSVLGEKQRKYLLNILSNQQKDTIKRVLLGKKEAERQRLKQIKYHLYNLGFIDKGLGDLEAYIQETNDPALKRIAAWEKVLWHANQYNAEDAAIALEYIPLAEEGEVQPDQKRRIAIIKAELLDEVGEREAACQVLSDALTAAEHADIYLALANLEADIKGRFTYINKALSLYGLDTIATDDTGQYDGLHTIKTHEDIKDGPLISVIIPAYNAGDGIRVAIESILEQTWQNIELIIVDDHSPDNTLEIVQEYAAKDSRIKVLQTPQNSGPYIARNIALEAAAGEFVTVNDSDDWSHASKLEIQAKHLLANKDVVANTSEHARITEEMTLYRRGTPGKYIFPNMSSIMFRRQPVIEKVGFWDSVRFAADGEFKRRLLKTFGTRAYVDLASGPLSLPRQAVTSLTGSSAFGYNGFFMGVRKEYVESLENHHQRAEDVRYAYPMTERPYPVPEPMWPVKEEKTDGVRKFDLVIAGDFRALNEADWRVFNDCLKTQADRIGLVQISAYDFTMPKKIEETIRQKLDGDRLQMLVYGEKIDTKKTVCIKPTIYQYHQKYLPTLTTQQLEVVLTETPDSQADLNNAAKHIESYFGQLGVWIPANEQIQKEIQNTTLASGIEQAYANRLWGKELS